MATIGTNITGRPSTIVSNAGDYLIPSLGDVIVHPAYTKEAREAAYEAALAAYDAKLSAGAL
jgi:hypothetical protein